MINVLDLAQQAREHVGAHYGMRLAGVVLYGSEALGEATPKSDIDLLVLLHGPFDRFPELRMIVDLLYPLQLTSDRLLSARPVSAEAYQSGTLQLYRNARHEGVAV